MRHRGPLLAVSSLALLVVGLRWRSTHVASAAPIEAKKDEPELSSIPLSAQGGTTRPLPPAPDAPDLTRIAVVDGVAVAPGTSGRPIKLTLHPETQRFTKNLLASHHLPEAAVVLTDVKTGKVLVYASHVEAGHPRDLCREATAPSASVFKVVTATALLEKGVADVNTLECYPDGGESRISAYHLRVDPARDRYCSTVAQAMGKSTNPVFARLAARHLQPAELESAARALGYGAPLPFDVAPMASEIKLPSDDLGFARTAAGFWNTTLSPVHAAWMATTIARGGTAVDLHLVDGVPAEEHKVLTKEHAEHLQAMLERTVTDGTSRRAFHDAHGNSFLGGMRTIGKTGTLSDSEKGRFYTWFMGAAFPQGEDAHPVGIAVLVVNKPTWKVKANVIAREVLRAHFSAEGAPHVTMPHLDHGSHPTAVASTVKKSARAK